MNIILAKFSHLEGTEGPAALSACTISKQYLLISFMIKQSIDITRSENSAKLEGTTTDSKPNDHIAITFKDFDSG